MRVIAFDTETWLIAAGRLAPDLVCVTTWDGTQRAIYKKADGLARMRAYLDDPAVYLVGHNVAFDLGVLVQADPTFLAVIWRELDAGRIGDTGILDQLDHIARGTFRQLPPNKAKPPWALAQLVERRLGETVAGKTGADAWRFRYRELADVELSAWPQPAVDYACEDARYTWRVWQVQDRDDAVDATLDFQVSAAFALHLMSAWGLSIDQVAVDELEARLTVKVDAAMGELRKAGIYRPDGSKDMSVMRKRIESAYFDAGKVTTRTEKGSISTAKTVLEASGDPVLALAATISNDQKLLSTYIPVLRQGKVNPRYSVLVASGRTSSWRPNIQNVPREGGVRECYVARPGYVYVACDWSIAELCALSQVLLDRFGWSQMAESLQAGRDLHLETAAGIMHVTYEDAEAMLAGGHGDDAKAQAKQARQLAKAAGFGFPGGLGATSGTFTDFAKATYGLDISMDDAQELKEQWLARFPEMRDYFAEIGNLVSSGGDSFTWTDPRTGYIRGDLGYCDGCNHSFQHLIAMAGKRAVIETAKQCWGVGGETPLTHSRPVAFIHDEVIIESPIDLADGAARHLEALMCQILNDALPDIPAKADAHMMRRWYKDAEAVYDKQGRLVPWEPAVTT